VRAAIDKVLIEIAGTAIAQAKLRDPLEDRVAALEEAAKPRVRVKAPGRRT
jgi:hypothetical protein